MKCKIWRSFRENQVDREQAVAAAQGAAGAALNEASFRCKAEATLVFGVKVGLSISIDPIRFGILGASVVFFVDMAVNSGLGITNFIGCALKDIVANTNPNSDVKYAPKSDFWSNGWGQTLTGLATNLASDAASCISKFTFSLGLSWGA